MAEGSESETGSQAQYEAQRESLAGIMPPHPTRFSRSEEPFLQA